MAYRNSVSTRSQVAPPQRSLIPLLISFLRPASPTSNLTSNEWHPE